MAEESSQEKTESPTQKRGEDSRKEGQVAYSKELSAATLLGAILLYYYMMGSSMLKKATSFLTSLFSNVALIEISMNSAEKLFSLFLTNVAFFVLPFFGTVFFVGLLISVLQVGLHASLKPITPNLEKISPLKGLGRIFSKQGFAELLKSLFKMMVIGYIGYLTFEDNFDEIMTLMNTDHKTFLQESFALSGLFCFRVFLAMSAMAAFDFLFQRWDMEQKLKMSKQDVKEENKQMEGDPQIKAKIRQIQQKMSQARMMQEVPKADAIITNPTHFAVAIAYDQEVMQAPQVIAKGMDFLALRMIDIADKSDVARIENPPWREQCISQVEIGEEIPEDFYKAIAEILAFVYRSKRKK